LERGGDGARAGGQEEEDWDLGWTPPPLPEPRALRRCALLVVGLVDSDEKVVEERRKWVRRGDSIYNLATWIRIRAGGATRGHVT
jgi:hypothetical protein